MKPIDLNKYGLVELSNHECIHIDGGGSLSRWFRGLTWTYALQEVASHWSDIKKGLSDGWDIDHSTKTVIK